jgi:hypothetical protein
MCGRSDTAAWGLCLGSGSTPYQVAVDIADLAYKCSCPSRKIPCKHALGLLFLLADAGVPAAEQPDWVREWLDTRANRAAVAATRAERSTEIDSEARARRVASREQKVAAGIDELDRWLRDLMRRGLDSTRGEGYRFWDAMGARLVDAQAGGLGRSVRGLGSAANSGDSWPNVLLEGVGRLHLLTQAYRRAERLPTDLQADIRALVGWTIKEDELDPTNAVEDRWLVIGRRVDDRGDIVTARTVLYGEASARVALHLAFGVGLAPPTLLALPGQAFRATLTFYPSSTPLRAAVQPPIVPDGEVAQIPGVATLNDVVSAHAERLARNPFVGAWPVLIANVIPVRRAGRLLVRDDAGMSLPIADSSLAPRLLAVSGGHPITIVAEWDGSWLRPLSTLSEGHVADMTSDGEFPAMRLDDPEWSQLVSAALLGTERTGGSVPVPAPVATLVAPTDREGSLLAAAGSMTVRRRAGANLTVDDTPVEPASPPDLRPTLIGPAARFVTMAFEERPSLVLEVLGLVDRSGRRLPDEWLPELLDLAKRSTDRAMAWAHLGGQRAAWLAAAFPELAGDVSWEIGGDLDKAWESAGTGVARASLIRRARQIDPHWARESIERRWADVPPEDRARIVSALDVGLGAADEPFLSLVATDRRADSRRAAAQLLVMLPKSFLTRRLEDEVRPLLSAAGLLRRNLKVDLPTAADDVEALMPAGRPPSGYGERGWLLRTWLAHVRPARWTEWLDIDPPGLVDRAIRSEEARPLLEGWIEATARFADVAWATALLRNPDVRTKIMVNIDRAIEGLSERDRAVALVASADALDPAILANLARGVPPPWPHELSDAVLGSAADLGREQFPNPALYELVRAGAVGLPPDRADDLANVASLKGELRSALSDPIETIRLRARIHDAFAALSPIQP